MNTREPVSKLFNADGSFRVKRIGLNHFALSEIYHTLVTQSWTRFFFVVSLTYVLIALLFTTAYWVVDPRNMVGLIGENKAVTFFELFLYSAQTLSTVGSAGVAPVGIPNNLIATAESMTALLCMAVITGLLYVRFSRPGANIVYSKNLLVSPYKQGEALMIRIANAKKNELDEVAAVVTLIRYDPKTRKRIFNELTLERDKIPFIPLSWTIVHPIDPESPFRHIGLDEEKDEWAIYVRTSGIDSITGQPVFSGHAYTSKDLVRNARFSAFHELNEREETLIYLARINDYEELTPAQK